MITRYSILLLLLLYGGSVSASFTRKGQNDVMELRDMQYCPTNQVKEDLVLNVPSKDTCMSLLHANDPKTFKADVSFVAVGD